MVVAIVSTNSSQCSQGRTGRARAFPSTGFDISTIAAGDVSSCCNRGTVSPPSAVRRRAYAASAGWAPGQWTVDLRWRRIGRRFPNAAGTNPRPPISLLDLSVEREVTSSITARAEARDLADARAEFIAGYPTPGRTVTLYLELTLP